MVGGIIIGKKKPQDLEKTLPSATLCIANVTHTAQASAMRSLSYGTALLHPWVGGVKGMEVII
jgi:hypothetical protein